MVQEPGASPICCPFTTAADQRFCRMNQSEGWRDQYLNTAFRGTKGGFIMLTIVPVVAIWMACTITLAVAGIIAATAED